MFVSLNVLSIQSLHCKNNWTSGNLDYAFQFPTGCHFIICNLNPSLMIFPYEMSFYQKPIKYTATYHIAISFHL